MVVYNPEVAKKTAVLTFRRRAYDVRPEDPFIYLSRIISPDYTDIRLFIGGPKERSKVIGYLVDATRSLKPDIIGSFVTADVPFASMVADRLDLPLFYMREEDKAHGRERNIEGMREEEIVGREILPIGDLITRGTTATNLVKGVRNVGGRVSYYLVIFDRLQGGSQALGSLKPPVVVVSLCEMDKNFYQAGIDSCEVNQHQIDEVFRYRQDQTKWAIEFLTQNPEWLKGKIAKSVSNGRLTKKDVLEVITVGYRDVPEIQALRPEILKWLEELGVEESVPEFGYRVQIK